MDQNYGARSALLGITLAFRVYHAEQLPDSFAKVSSYAFFGRSAVDRDFNGVGSYCFKKRCKEFMHVLFAHLGQRFGVLPNEQTR